MVSRTAAATSASCSKSSVGIDRLVSRNDRTSPIVGCDCCAATGDAAASTATDIITSMPADRIRSTRLPRDPTGGRRDVPGQVTGRSIPRSFSIRPSHLSVPAPFDQGVCVTVNVWPAIVTVPTLLPGGVAGLIPTRYETVPLPVPGLPLTTVIQDTLLTAVQAQPVAVVTLTVPVPPRAPIVLEVGLIVNPQPDAWLMVNVWPAIVSVPCRAGPVLAFHE